jgi:hypothetical protein
MKKPDAFRPRRSVTDLGIKKPISGRPEIGAQFQLWIFSYHIFAHSPKKSVSRLLLARLRAGCVS